MPPYTKADLFFHEGSSDKEYHIQLESVAGGYVVNFQYGRRGSTLKCGAKTTSPVDLNTAQKIYDKVLNEKLDKGYMETCRLDGKEADSSVQEESKYTPVAEDTSKVIFIPQLLNTIDECEVEKYLRNDAFGMQEKQDGLHQAVHKSNGDLFTTNKKGKKTNGYVATLNKSAGMTQDFILDAEAVGETYRCFDLLEAYGMSYRAATYQERYEALEKLFQEGIFSGCLKLVPLAIGTKAKKALYEKLKADGREGVVFKRLDSVYVPGKSHSDMFKMKFYAELSAIVAAGREGKMSIGLELIDGSKRVFMGNCTIPSNWTVPSINSVCEIRYLYAYKGGSLYQPCYKGPRTDVDVEECLISQVKYKAEED